MTRIRVIGRMACALAGLAGALLALSATASAAFAYDLPPSGGGGATTPATRPTLPPGSSKHPPSLHAVAHTAVSGGMPGWQLTLIAIAAAVLGAALAVTIDRILAARRRVSTRAPNPRQHTAGPARPPRRQFIRIASQQATADSTGTPNLTEGRWIIRSRPGCRKP